MAIGLDIVILFILLLLSGFFSGSEVALVSLSKHKAKQLVEEKKAGSLFALKLKEDPNRMLATILIGNNVVNVAAAAITTSIALQVFSNYAVGIATGIMTLLLLVFGEITPKTLASNKAELVSRLVAPIIWYMSIILAPLLAVLDGMIGRVFGVFGIKPRIETISEEEIISMVKTAEEEGSIKAIERNLIRNVFRFDDKNVGAIITARADMVMMSQSATVKETLDLMQGKSVSRIPVYERTRDNIVGIVYFRDLMGAYLNGNTNTQIKSFVNSAYFIPDTKTISSLLRQFQRRKEHMAIVVDEHGSVVGLVTMEDVLEEIVGEIMDESDKIDPHIISVGKNKWTVLGKADVDDVNQTLKMKLDGDDYDTFSGFIMKQAGRIPSLGEVIVYNKFRIKIEDVTDNRIISTTVEKF